MSDYTNRITLVENERGVFSLDPSIGCHAGTLTNPRGCYHDCYAVNAARRYGRDFSKTVYRYFDNQTHAEIKEQIARIPMPFVRMGTSGDPSENWEHTLNICKTICQVSQLSFWPVPLKEIVIITKHWTRLTDEQVREISNYPICINTSVSALDEVNLWQNVAEFIRLKPYCKSVLRIVSADFNLENPDGARLAKIQDELFKHSPTLDTVLRVSKNNPYILNGLIKVKLRRFLGARQLISKHNRKTYMGKCGTCREMCGITMAPKLRSVH